MVVVPIGSPLVISYMTSIVSNIVSLTALEVFNVKALWPRSRTVWDHLSHHQRCWCQSTAHGWLPIWLLLTPLLYLSPYLKYLTCHSNDLELGLFNVIQSQMSWCQLIAW